MLFDKRLDKTFEEAGRNEEQFDKLLERYQRQRSRLSIILTGILFLFLVLAAWLIFEGFQLIHQLAGALTPSASASDPKIEIPSIPQWLEIISGSSAHRSVFIGFVLLLYTFILGLALNLRDADSRVKTLLLFRSFREANKSDARNATSGGVV